MKKFWKKALGLITLATVVPVSITHNEETGKTTYQSLLATLDVGPNKDGVHTDIGLNVGEGVLTGRILKLTQAKKEARLYADDEPEAAIPFPAAPEGTDPTPDPAVPQG